MKVGTVSLLLVLIWTLCFVTGGYEVYRAWADHEGGHGAAASPPLGLPEFPATERPRMRLGA